MGNSIPAHFCSGPGAERCCSSWGNEAANEVTGNGAPVGAEPLNSSDLMDIDAADVLGIGKQGRLAPLHGFGEGGLVSGADSAAGGGQHGLHEKQECQYVTYEDGSTYTGQIADGKRQGHGLWKSTTGQYEGQWKADAQHGRGRQTWSDGRIYDGQFLNGRFAGHGRMVWHTNKNKGLLIYEGQYKDDLKHGAGKFVWADGRTYDGEWFNGHRHGRGLYMNAKSEKKVGYWADDKFLRWETAEEAGRHVSEMPAP